MDSLVLLLICLGGFVLACVLFVWLVGRAAVGVTHHLQKPRPRPPVRVDAAAQSAERDAKRRREEARAACEVLYAHHRPEVAARFGREEFDAFVRKHLGDERTPEYVVERSRQLQDVIRGHLRKVEPATGAGASEARAMVQRYYAEHVALLGAGYPTALFEATLNALVPESAPREAAWAAARELIGQLQEAAGREETRRKTEERARQGRERRLRRIERERGEIREHLARLKTFDETGDGPRMEDEIERQEAKARDLEEERENLLSLNEGEP